MRCKSSIPSYEVKRYHYDHFAPERGQHGMASQKLKA